MFLEAARILNPRYLFPILFYLRACPFYVLTRLTERGWRILVLLSPREAEISNRGANLPARGRGGEAIGATLPH